MHHQIFYDAIKCCHAFTHTFRTWTSSLWSTAMLCPLSILHMRFFYCCIVVIIIIPNKLMWSTCQYFGKPLSTEPWEYKYGETRACEETSMFYWYFLSDRTFQIHLGTILSDKTFHQEDGVPQGVKLSTNLFSVKLIDIVKQVDPGVRMWMTLLLGTNLPLAMLPKEKYNILSIG